MDTFEEWADSHRIDGRPLVEVIEDAYFQGIKDAEATTNGPGRAYRVRKGDYLHPKTYAKIGPAKQARSYHIRLKGAVIEELSGYWMEVNE